MKSLVNKFLAVFFWLGLALPLAADLPTEQIHQLAIVTQPGIHYSLQMSTDLVHWYKIEGGDFHGDSDRWEMTLDANKAAYLLLADDATRIIDPDSRHIFYRFLLDDPSGTMSAEDLQVAAKFKTEALDKTAELGGAGTNTPPYDPTDPFMNPPTPTPTTPETPTTPAQELEPLEYGLDSFGSSVYYSPRTQIGGYSDYVSGTDELVFQDLISQGYTIDYHDTDGWTVHKEISQFSTSIYQAANPKFNTNTHVQNILTEEEINAAVTNKTDYTNSLTDLLSFSSDPASESSRKAKETYMFFQSYGEEFYKSPDTAEADFPEASWGQYWLRASKPAPERLARTYLLITEETEGGNMCSGFPLVNVVNLIIDKGHLVSTVGTTDGVANNGVISLKPVCAKGRTRTMKLTQVGLYDQTSGVYVDAWDGLNNSTLTNYAVAWIKAHTDETDPAPQMPHLSFNTYGLPDGSVLLAKLEVDYTRGNGAKNHEDQDLVQIPEGGAVYKAGDFDDVEFGDEMQQMTDPGTGGDVDRPFFGGKAKITYKIIYNGSTLLEPKIYNFAIGGKNPDNDRCKAYIQSQPNAGATGNIWFSYAIAKHETAEYRVGTNPKFYNQFINDRHLKLAKDWYWGSPTYNNDEPKDKKKPGGYGIFQNTGNVSDSKAIIPRQEIWNWQEGAKAGLAIIRSKRTGAASEMQTRRTSARTQTGNDVLVPTHTLPRAPTESGTLLGDATDGAITSPRWTLTDSNVTDAVTIKRYNGAAPLAPGAVTGTGDYCIWRDDIHRWEFRRWRVIDSKVDQRSYVDLVIGEVEP